MDKKLQEKIERSNKEINEVKKSAEMYKKAFRKQADDEIEKIRVHTLLKKEEIEKDSEETMKKIDEIYKQIEEGKAKELLKKDKLL